MTSRRRTRKRERLTMGWAVAGAHRDVNLRRLRFFRFTHTKTSFRRAKRTVRRMGGRR